MAPVLADVADPRPHAQARRLRQQVRHVLHPRPHRRHRRRWASTRCRCRRTRGRRPGRPSRSRARAPGPRHRVVDQPLGTAGARATRTGRCPTTCRARSTPRTGTSRSCSIPGHGGGADWSHQSFSHSTELVYTGYGYVAAAHSLTEASNGLRPPGEYQTGGIVAVDPSTNRVRWKKHMPYSLAHGNGILTTGQRPAVHRPARRQPAGAGRHATATSCGASRPAPRSAAARSRTRSTASSTSRSTPAAPASRTADSRTAAGDFLWAFKLGGTRRRRQPTPTPPVIRRPVSGGPVEGSVVNNTVVLARTYNADHRRGRHHRVHRGQRHGPDPPAGPGRHHGDLRQPGRQRQRARRDPVLRRAVQRPARAGRVVQLHVHQPGEFFFNDCFSPRPTGKVQVLALSYRGLREESEQASFPLLEGH